MWSLLTRKCRLPDTMLDNAPPPCSVGVASESPGLLRTKQRRTRMDAKDLVQAMIAHLATFDRSQEGSHEEGWMRAGMISMTVHAVEVAFGYGPERAIEYVAEE